MLLRTPAGGFVSSTLKFHLRRRIVSRQEVRARELQTHPELIRLSEDDALERKYRVRITSDLDGGEAEVEVEFRIALVARLCGKGMIIGTLELALLDQRLDRGDRIRRSPGHAYATQKCSQNSNTNKGEEPHFRHPRGAIGHRRSSHRPPPQFAALGSVIPLI